MADNHRPQHPTLAVPMLTDGPVIDDTQSTSSTTPPSRNDEFRNTQSGSVSVPLKVSRKAYNQERFDKQFGWIEPDSRLMICTRLRSLVHCSGPCLWRVLIGFLPIIDWLPKYSIKEDLASDLVAGLTVGIMHIPQGMAYADLAGLEPVYGLYTSFFPSLFYMFFGVFAVVSLMVGQVRLGILPDIVIEAHRTGNLSLAPESTDWNDPVTQLSAIEVVTCLTMAVGFIQLLMGLLRLGFVTAYLSDQVISGFTTGAACHVFTAQINKVMNVKLPRFSGTLGLFKTYNALIRDVPNASWLSIGVSIATMFICVIGKEFINPPIKKRFSVPIPWELIVVVLGTIISHYCYFNEEFGLAIVSDIPTGLPYPKVPPMWLMPRLIGDALSIAIVVFVITISLGKLFAKKHHYRIDPDQECFALGFMQVLSCFFAVFPASTALARSLIYEAAGVRTQLATIWTCGLLFVVLMWLGPLFKALPMCVLASIILVALKGMFMQLKQLKELWPVSKIDFAIWLVSFVATVVFDVRNGLIIGIAFALITSIWRSQRPPSVTLGRLPDTEIYRDIRRFKHMELMDGMAIFRFDSPLMFTNTEKFKDDLYEHAGIDLAECRTKLNDKLKTVERKKKQLDEKKNQSEQTSPLQDDQEDDEPPPVVAILNGVSTAPTTRSTTPMPTPVTSDIPEYVILDCSGFNYIDYMGVQALRELYTELAEIGVVFLYASLKGPVRDMMEAAHFFEKVPRTAVFPTVHCAVTYAQACREKWAFVKSTQSIHLSDEE